METTTLQQTWKIDTANSEVAFKIKHMLVSTVTGRFLDFSGAVTTHGDDFENANVVFAAKARSVDTGIQARDRHLRSDEFFSADQFPEITFASISFSRIDDASFLVIGKLTIRDQTRIIELKATGPGMIETEDDFRVTFEIVGAVNRRDFKLNYGAVTEAGGLVVSEHVDLVIHVQLKSDKIR